MAFEGDVAEAKRSGRPFRIVLAREGNAVHYLTQDEIDQATAAKATATAKEAAIRAKEQALFSAAAAIAPLPSPHQQSLTDLYSRYEGLLAYLRLKFPEDVQ